MPGYLLDTNVLLRAADKAAPEHAQIAAALMALAAAGEPLYITAQVVAEFWAVATRPIDVNGFQWDAVRTRAEVEWMLNEFTFLEDLPGVFPEWLELVTRYGVAGKPVHDARLVALMRVHGTDRILTLNVDDFRRYSEVTAVHPSAVRL